MKTNEYVLDNCNIIHVENDCEITLGSIYVKDGKIAAMGEVTTANVKRIDMQGAYVAPGLVNLHVHLFGTGKPSKVLGGGGLQKFLIKFVKGTWLGRQIVHKLVSGGAKTELMSGATTIRTVGDFVYSDVWLRDKVNAGKKVGPRMLVSGPAITAPGGHGDGTFSMSASGEEDLRELVRKNVEHGVDFIKICVTGGVMDAKKIGEPGEVKMTLEQTKAVCDEAHKLGKIVASHTESENGVHVAVLGGVDTIEHGSPYLPEDMEDHKANSGAMVITFSPAVPLANISPSLTKLNEMAVFNTKYLIAEMIKGAHQCMENGETLGMGTDASCPFASQYAMPNEVFMFSKLLNVDSAYALTTATKTNAEIARLGDVCGTLEVGKSADIIAMKQNPLEDLTALTRLDAVVCRGKFYKKPKAKHNKLIDSEMSKILATM